MDKITELLTRGVANIIPGKDVLEKELRSGKRLRVYQGFDPTSPELHIGHMAGLRKLKQWQELGHEVIFLIGDFTGMIGDPTGKDKTRIELSREQVLENAKTYKHQAGKILRFKGENPVLVKYNSEWLGKMSAIELANLTSYLTIQQVIERDMFQKRLENNMNIAMSEFLYPFMQGYDSVAMDVDLEVGGNDQLFNMMTGRDLMHKIKRKNKFVMTTPLLIDSTGRKIGKSEGNAIALDDTPEEIFGKIMGLGDSVIGPGLEYLTDISLDEIKTIEQAIHEGKNPMQYKKVLAYEIVKQLNDISAAKNAQEHFEKTVQNQEMPDEIPTVTVSPNHTVVDVLVESSIAASKSEAKRLIEQKGVAINGMTVNDSTTLAANGAIISVGHRKFVKIEVR